jgi:hypothetical protein
MEIAKILACDMVELHIGRERREQNANALSVPAKNSRATKQGNRGHLKGYGGRPSLRRSQQSMTFGLALTPNDLTAR